MLIHHRVRVSELASPDACLAIAQLDAQVLSAGSSFPADNQMNYYLGINTWLCIIQSYCDDAWVHVWDCIQHDGLYRTVIRFADAAPLVIRGEPVNDPVIDDVFNSIIIVPRNFRVTSMGYRPTEMSVKLQICRYLKRMSPLGGTMLDEKAISAFKANQELLRDSADPGVWNSEALCFLGKVRSYITASLPWAEIMARITEDPVGIRFTTGAASDSSPSLVSKLQRINEQMPDYLQTKLGPIVPVGCGEDFKEFAQPAELAHLGWIVPGTGVTETHSVKLATAPKSMASPRIIAMEPVFYQCREKYLQEILYDYLPVGMNLRDQSLNQERAFEGSKSGRYATLDLSAASDFVSKFLVTRVFPEQFCRFIAPLVPTSFVHLGESSPLYSFATMGNGLTFWVESVIFRAIASVAAGTDDVIVYGDDIIVPSASAGDVVDALTMLGFRINTEKSYWEGSFRESCGVEYYDGVPTQSIYYPRFPVPGTIGESFATFSDSYRYNEYSGPSTALSSVIELQHRLTNISLKAALFLAQVVKDAVPNMTTHRWGTDCSDLWGVEDLLIDGPSAPYGRFEWKRYSVFYPPFVDGDSQLPCVYAPGVRGPIRGYVPDVISGKRLVTQEEEREARHNAVSMVVTNEKSDNVLVQAFRYRHFLEHGPAYASDLDRQLGISSPPNAVLDTRYGVQVTWTEKLDLGF